MRKQTVTLVTCAAVVLFNILAPTPINSLFNDECFDCYTITLEGQSCDICLSLVGSTSMGCYQVGACDCVTLFPGQCNRC